MAEETGFDMPAKQSKSAREYFSSLPYSDAERREDAFGPAKRLAHAKAVIAACPSGQRYDLPFDPIAHKRLQRRLGERD